MNRVDRLTAILMVLQSRRLVTASYIADRFEISLRTVYRDVRALQEIGIPVNGEAGLGYYLMEGYKLPPIIFSKEEAGALLLSQKIVEKLTDHSLQKHFNQAIDKIRAVLKTAEKDRLENLEDGIRFLGSDKSIKGAGTHMVEIQNAIADRHTVLISYTSEGKDNAQEREIEPIGLVFYSNRWHMIGFCHLRDDYRDFRLDRIQSLSVTGRSFKMSLRKDIDAYLKELYSIHALDRAIVRFSKPVADKISNYKYYYGFVSQKEHSDYVDMEFMLPDYDYFSRWLFMFADDVDIIEPPILIEHLRKLSLKVQEKYLSPNLKIKNN